MSEQTQDRTPQTATQEPDDTQFVPTATMSDAEAASKTGDKELELYRSLLEAPKEFKNGFTWTVVAGALFCGLLMMPGSIYLSLMTGGSINASWVTLIIFSEISRRALKTLCTQELVILLNVAGAMAAGGPIAALIFRQYFVQSDAVRDAGLLGQFPSWWAPQPVSAAITDRNLLHADWLIPVLLILFLMIIGRVKSYTLGYFFFRLTSDIEKLPFPFAPISAQGSMALAESGDRKTSWKWKVFSVGAILGMLFAIIQIGIPLVTGAVLAKPIQIVPLPWLDTTTMTESFLPATPTGLVIDLGLVLMGMVIPFWAIVGTGCALLLTFIMNPILHQQGILTRWQPGMDTIATSFVNSIDFWMSFGIGVTAGVAIISLYQSIRDLVKQLGEQRKRQKSGASMTAREENLWATPEGRGDFSPWLAVGIYVLSAILLIVVTHSFIPRFPIGYLIFFAFIYTPFISYLNARLIAINGQQVEIPLLREGVFILSGYKGIDIWLAPIPIDNYGAMAQTFRIKELTGTNFWSYIKADMFVVPLSFALSFIFWAFIWHSTAIPSESFPWAQKMWDLQAKTTMLTWSATMETGGAKPLFFQALHPWVIWIGFGFTSIAFGLLAKFALPTMAIYGFIRGVGGMPHAFLPEIIGALIGRFYFQKRFGETPFLQMAPVLCAGYGTGVGLIALIGVAINLITKAISSLPL
jgi:hypothetical protein